MLFRSAVLVPDIPLALKMFLQAVDMTDDEEQDGVAPRDTVPTAMVLRAWFGVKLVRPSRCTCDTLALMLSSVNSARTK